MREIKYIIVKDKLSHFRHYKSEWQHHYNLARDKGYNEGDILEAGLFLEGQLYILECKDLKHLSHKAGHYIGNNLNYYQDLRLSQWLKGRELESQLYYKIKPILKEGD